MTTVLIDADIIIYKAACGAEKEMRWPDGIWTYSADEQEGINLAQKKIDEIVEETKADKYILCFSSSDNFRKEIYPAYKSNRKDSRVPLIRKFLIEHFQEQDNVAIIQGLEADDVLGILATRGVIKDPIIASTDKDLLQIPVMVYNFDTKEFNPPEHRDCERIFYSQVLTGDPVDGYPGCPNIGTATAEEILDAPYLWEEYEHEFKSGKRKGSTETRYRKVLGCSVWEAIVSHYEKAGLNEEDAIAQAQCAKILQSENYNEKDRTINHWRPHE